MKTNPLYSAEKQIQYQKHRDRIKSIAYKKFSCPTINPNKQEKSKPTKHSSVCHSQEKIYKIKTQNNKILSKLLQISQRTSLPVNSTIASHSIPKAQNIISYNNPQRKRRQKEIISSNNRLAQRLMEKQSQFDRHKTMKSIKRYEKVRRTLLNNKKIKLVPLRKQSGTYDLTTVSTLHYSKVEGKPLTLSSKQF